MHAFGESAASDPRRPAWVSATRAPSREHWKCHVFEVGGRGRAHASIAFFKLQARRAQTAPAADIAGTQHDLRARNDCGRGRLRPSCPQCQRPRPGAHVEVVGTTYMAGAAGCRRRRCGRARRMRARSVRGRRQVHLPCWRPRPDCMIRAVTAPICGRPATACTRPAAHVGSMRPSLPRCKWEFQRGCMYLNRGGGGPGRCNRVLHERPRPIHAALPIHVVCGRGRIHACKRPITVPDGFLLGARRDVRVRAAVYHACMHACSECAPCTHV